MDKNSLKNNPGLYFYHQILLSQLKIFNIKQKKNKKMISNIKTEHY